MPSKALEVETQRGEEKSYIPYCIQTAPHPQKL